MQKTQLAVTLLLLAEAEWVGIVDLKAKLREQIDSKTVSHIDRIFTNKHDVKPSERSE